MTFLRQVKKITSFLFSLVFLIAFVCQTVSAIDLSPRASDYLNGYGASFYPGSTKGSVRVAFTVTATRHSDRVGVSELVIYKSNGSRVATISGTVSNGLMCEDTTFHMGDYTYYGEAGVSYYAKLTIYAERDGGSDSRIYLTNTCTAPS